jgi:predicted ATPase
MNLRKENFYIITGGPGVGKTTLLNELVKSGFKIVHEDAREIIKQQIETNGDGLPWKNKELYTQLMLEASQKSYQLASQLNFSDICFFDRGILDTLCYADMIGLGISPEMDNIAKTHLYNRKVFILPPWLEIYHTDNERRQTWEEAVFTFEKIKDIYSKYGYEIVEVPKDTVENRVKFIVNILTS